MAMSPEWAQPEPREVYFHEYGTFIVTPFDAFKMAEGTRGSFGYGSPAELALVSQPDWQNTLEVLRRTVFGNMVVLTPELVTIAGEPILRLEERRERIEQSLQEASQVSKEQPEATFVIGSPYFVKDDTRPYNAAVVFKNGKLASVARKRVLAGLELDAFACRPEDLPTKVDNATLLVCRDLIGVQQERLKYGANNLPRYIEMLTGNFQLAQRFASTEMIAPKSRRLLVEACWGISTPIDVDDQESLDKYFKDNLRMTAQSIMRLNPDMDQIVVCDRSPGRIPDLVTSSMPMSAVFSSK